MRINKKRATTGQKRAVGFTIVELLIVIVVIGVLASITVVAYGGVQNRARNAQMLAAIDAYEKVIRLYMTEHDGQVPASPLSATGYPELICLGDNYPASKGFSKDRCMLPDVEGGPATYAPINDALKQYVPQLPIVSQNVFTSRSSEPTFTSLRGLLYQGYNDIANDTAALIAYYIDGGQVCGRGQSGSADIGGVTVTLCQVVIR